MNGILKMMEKHMQHDKVKMEMVAKARDFVRAMGKMLASEQLTVKEVDEIFLHLESSIEERIAVKTLLVSLRLMEIGHVDATFADEFLGIQKSELRERAAKLPYSKKIQ